MLDNACDAAAVATSAALPLAQTDLLSGASLPLAQRDLPSCFRSNLTSGTPDEPRPKRLHDDCDVDISYRRERLDLLARKAEETDPHHAKETGKSAPLPSPPSHYRRYGCDRYTEPHTRQDS
ncbi:hypothetical protein HPB48_003016 [Haemaphysalis longicornis]|uniref:Uncharacterized protein n=1 Tax=Haemaphysalis longicornis TaxID=44386 RepID=A0A9J6FDW7_HAELO|nr:hypothetical protein HPB48_003016 [Haemaphysalis longicornis]